MNEYEALVVSAVRDHRTVMFLGALDSGKSTLTRALLAAALDAGRSCAYLDADPGQTSVGPPATVGMKLVRSRDDLVSDRLAVADGLAFVGSTSAQGHVLPMVTGSAGLLRKAHDAGADFVAVDTSGMVSGIHGQLLKYHKMELLQPDLVVGLQRGEELQPLLGIAQRFFATEVVSLGIHPGVVPTSVEQRAEHREAAMRRYFSGQLHRFRVKPTVFLPSCAAPAVRSLHARSAHRRLFGRSGLLRRRGVPGARSRGRGPAADLPVADAPKALRLGSVRLEETFRVKRVDLRNLFGTE